MTMQTIFPVTWIMSNCPEYIWPTIFLNKIKGNPCYFLWELFWFCKFCYLYFNLLTFPPWGTLLILILPPEKRILEHIVICIGFWGQKIILRGEKWLEFHKGERISISVVEFTLCWQFFLSFGMKNDNFQNFFLVIKRNLHFSKFIFCHFSDKGQIWIYFGFLFVAV